jgi:hypothetical protein
MAGSFDFYGLTITYGRLWIIVFSMAVFAALLFAGAAGIEIPDGCAALKAWHARVSELPSVKNRSGQNLEAEDLRRLGF